MRVVIVGGGLAAATVAEQLREKGFAGSVDLVTAENHRPYQRPPLSKGYLLGSEGRDGVYAHAAGWEESQNITLHLADAAVRIGDGTVTLESGTELAFDRLVLATGASPRAFEIPGSDAAGVRVLRTIDDADRLRADLEGGGRRVAIIGSGWIGLETAAAARELDNFVTVISPDRVPLARALGDEMGEVFLDLHREHGVVFLGERHATAFETGSDGAVTGVRVGDDVIPADLVIVGIGAVPNTALAEAAGIAVDNGMLVDAHMNTSVPGVLAVGDVAHVLHPVLGERIRTEHWGTAIESGKVAAATIMGEEASLDSVPYFFTDQYDLGMEFSGYAPLMAGAHLIIRGNTTVREFIAFWVADGRVVAGMNVNIWDVNEQVQRLIRDRVGVDEARLADAEVPLAEL